MSGAKVVDKNVGDPFKINLNDLSDPKDEKKPRIIRVLRVPKSIAEQWERCIDGTTLGVVDGPVTVKDKGKDVKMTCISLFAMKEGVPIHSSSGSSASAASSSTQYLLENKTEFTEKALAFKLSEDNQRRCELLGETENYHAKKYEPPVNKRTRGGAIPNNSSSNVNAITVVNDNNNSGNSNSNSSSSSTFFGSIPKQTASNNNSNSSSSLPSSHISGSKRKLSQEELDNIKTDIHVRLKRKFTTRDSRFTKEQIKEFLKEEMRFFDHNVESAMDEILQQFYERIERGDFRNHYRFK